MQTDKYQINFQYLLMPAGREIEKIHKDNPKVTKNCCNFVEYLNKYNHGKTNSRNTDSYRGRCCTL